jgi:hypothetical protein
MTNKAEDKFYFGKPGQPERFAKIDGSVTSVALANPYLSNIPLILKDGRRVTATRKDGRWSIAEMPEIPARRATTIYAFVEQLNREGFSRPGQPERFSRIDSMLSDASAYVADGSDEASGILSDLIKERNRGTLSQEQVRQLNNIIREARAMGVFSCPGQPDKFDASSLNRGDFAEASTSPMLGKLLAAKVMPEGGWRAVQVGSDTLVISFEDADLASDFGRRVATKGYNATSPVQAIGRYWNVEVKNGK